MVPDDTQKIARYLSLRGPESEGPRRGGCWKAAPLLTTKTSDGVCMEKERFTQFHAQTIDAVVRVATADNAAVIAALPEHPRLEITEQPAGNITDRLRVLVAFRPPNDEDILGYDWIHCAGAGMDHLVRALHGNQDRWPVITRTIGRMGEQMGGYCLSYILADLQKHEARRRAQMEKTWDSQALAPWEIFDQDMTVIGTGAIGSGIARVLKPLVRSVRGLSRSGKDHPDFDEVRPWNDPGSLCASAFVIAALPAAPSTAGLIDATFFSRLEGTFFINVGRGVTVAMDDLCASLGNGHLRHAVLDVFEEEPLPTDHWCWEHPSITVTPHVSGITRPADSAEAFLTQWRVLLASGWSIASAP